MTERQIDLSFQIEPRTFLFTRSECSDVEKKIHPLHIIQWYAKFCFKNVRGIEDKKYSREKNLELFDAVYT